MPDEDEGIEHDGLVEHLVDYMGTLVPGQGSPSLGEHEHSSREQPQQVEADSSHTTTPPDPIPPALPPKKRTQDLDKRVNGSIPSDHQDRLGALPPPAVPPRRRDRKPTPPVSQVSMPCFVLFLFYVMFLFNL